MPVSNAEDVLEQHAAPTRTHGTPTRTHGTPAQEVIGMFTSRDLLGELARYPNKADGLKTKAHEFMIPLSRMIYASAKDSLYQCLLVMSELKVRRAAGRDGGFQQEDFFFFFLWSGRGLVAF